jgi:hypothetical protein
MGLLLEAEDPSMGLLLEAEDPSLGLLLEEVPEPPQAASAKAAIVARAKAKARLRALGIAGSLGTVDRIRARTARRPSS